MNTVQQKNLAKGRRRLKQKRRAEARRKDFNSNRFILHFGIGMMAAGVVGTLTTNNAEPLVLYIMAHCVFLYFYYTGKI